MRTGVMLCAALGGFLFGYDTTVINAALFQMKYHFGFDDHSWKYGLIVSIAIIGAFVGAFAAGFLSAKFGRRPAIVMADILFIVGTALMAGAPSVTVILVSRVIVGLAIGISSATIPVYLGEVTAPKHRGAAIVLNNVFLTGAQFLAAGIGALFVVYTGNNFGWRVSVAIGAVPAILQLVLLLTEALLVAQRYEVDLGEYTATELRTVRLDYRPLFAKEMRFRIVYGCMLQIIQQFSGINTIMYYSSVILKDAGFDGETMPVILSVPLAFMNALFTVIALFTVDRVGRRFMLVLSIFGCFATTCVVAVVGFLLGNEIPYSVGGWLFLGLLSVFLAFYAPGIGCIPWVVMGEVFPQHLRTSAASLATMSNWAANALVSQVFPMLMGSAIGVGGTFTLICFLLLLSSLYIYFFAVETKGYSLEELDNMFRVRAGLEPVYRRENELEEPVVDDDEDDGTRKPKVAAASEAVGDNISQGHLEEGSRSALAWCVGCCLRDRKVEVIVMKLVVCFRKTTTKKTSGFNGNT
eukprot:gene7400-5211_t